MYHQYYYIYVVVIIQKCWVFGNAISTNTFVACPLHVTLPGCYAVHDDKCKRCLKWQLYKKYEKSVMHWAKTLLKNSKQNNNNNKTLRIEVLKACWDVTTRSKNVGTQWQAPMCRPKFATVKYQKCTYH